MVVSGELTEHDLALLEALQSAPRAPWAAVARATNSSPVTAARRWHRLVESGAAWVVGAPGMSVWNAQCVAYVDITCRPGQRVVVAETLAQDRHALSVDLTAGSADLFVTVAAADLRALSRYLLERIDTVPGVTSTRTRVSTRLYRDGSHWRIGASTRGPTAVIDVAHDPTGVRPAAHPQPGDQEILVALGLDGRAHYAALAETAALSEATARRRVARLLRTGTVLLRTEVAANLAGWPVPVVLFLDAPSTRLVETARAIARLRQVRLCATLAGTPPIVVVVWLHDVEAIHRFEMELVTEMPHITVVDRLVTLRSIKRMGRLLDVDGRAVGTVPMDVWTDPMRTA